MAAAGTLGAGSYSVRFVRRKTLAGPRYIVGQTVQPVALTWARALNKTTDASATFPLGTASCVDTLALVEPWRDEMEIYRNPGGLCWVGPVGDVIANAAASTATVPARDLSAWWAMRGLFEKIIHRKVDLATIFTEYLAIAFDVDDPGVQVEATPIGVLGDRTIAAADLKMLDTALGELSTSGVDWTTAARTFFVGGVEISSASRLPGRFVDEHFAAPPQTRRSGTGMVTDARVRGNKYVGAYGGPDPVDGVLIQAVQDQAAIADQESADAAAQTWWERAHNPLSYLDGDNDLAPGAPVTIDQLIPGLLAFIDVKGGGVVPVQRTLRLESLAVNVTPDAPEKVTVSFQPPGTQAA